MAPSGSGFHWAPSDASGNDLPATPSFATQEEAEAWLTAQWQSLLARGAEHVELRHEGRVLYRMGLREA